MFWITYKKSPQDNKMAKNNQKVCLVIIDGWGHRTEKKGNAIEFTDCMWMKTLSNKYNTYLLSASGADVGLPDNQMGNSMVGHITIGAGRVLQPQKKISGMIQNGKFKERLKKSGIFNEKGSLHLIGLVSDSGIHPHISHLFDIIDCLKDQFTKNWIHFIADGRDTCRMSAIHYFDLLSKKKKN